MTPGVAALRAQSDAILWRLLRINEHERRLAARGRGKGEVPGI